LLREKCQLDFKEKPRKKFAIQFAIQSGSMYDSYFNLSMMGIKWIRHALFRLYCLAAQEAGFGPYQENYCQSNFYSYQDQVSVCCKIQS
jgi:hypothetical protein